jgi:hypothetical protein
MATKTKTSDRKPASGFDREDFTKKGLKKIADLQAGVLKARETLRNKTGALKEATNEFHQGLADGCQLDLHFGKQDEGDGDEPEELSGAAAG